LSDDGRLRMTNNAAERARRCVPVGRNNWTFGVGNRNQRAGKARACHCYQCNERIEQG
jgi:Transposase IS66 family